ncbi:MAG TPA: hypothetical protein VHF47_01695, partial [Acidimicrobiales bacterium]|nr:hypothetical protein [Acidimicrobiales bacterium]
MTTTLLHVLLERAAATPERAFTVDVAGRSLSYAEAVDGARRWAAAYRRLGVARHDLVATMQLNSVDGML